jgi:hypothetical protein
MFGNGKVLENKVTQLGEHSVPDEGRELTIDGTGGKGITPIEIVLELAEQPLLPIISAYITSDDAG